MTNSHEGYLMVNWQEKSVSSNSEKPFNIDKCFPALPAPTNTACLALPIPNSLRYYEWGEKLFESHHLKGAVDAYSECLKIDPTHEYALYKRGLTNGLLKNKESALNDLSSVLIQRFLKEAKICKQNIEAPNQEIKENIFPRAISDSSEFFEAISDFQDIGKNLQTVFDNLMTDQEYEQINSEIKNFKETTKILPEFATDAKLLQKSQDPNEKNQQEITFSCVQGLDKVKERLWNNIVLPMKRPDLFTKYQKKRSFAVLLYGPPGCGKTLIVRALAGETNSYLISVKLHELMDRWVGETEKNIHRIFEEARWQLKKGYKSCIIFLDEIDSIGVNRGLVRDEHNGLHRDIVNQLLTELDGIEKNPQGLFIIAASNRPWDIDTALRRSGRIGDTIYIPPPSNIERKQLFTYYIGNCKIRNLNYDYLVAQTEACSAADIEAIVEEAKIYPIIREHQTGIESALTMDDFETALKEGTIGKGALKDYYFSVTNELTNPTINAEYYKPMIEDAKKVLQKNKSEKTITPSI
jgi:SpoVK/Ycf46/Vps4 family AAA+-type ATPase